MKHIIHTDENHYVIGLELTTNGGVEVPSEVFYSSDLTCYKYENEVFTFDAEKKSAEDTKRQNTEERNRLKAELATYDYIGTKIAMGVATREDYATEIAYTEELRQRIRELEAYEA